MARRHRHNQGGGKQPRQRMFDESRKKLFEYDARQVLEDAPIDEDHHKAFIQQVMTRGSRQGLDEAKEFVQEKTGEDGFLDDESASELESLLEKYSKYR